MKKYTILIIPLLFFMAHCQKEELSVKTNVNGFIVSSFDSVPVPFATVYLHQGQDGQKIDSTKADSKGKFRIDFTAEKNTMYGITAKQEKYFESSKHYFYLNGFYQQYLREDGLKVAAYAKSFIRVHVKDETRNERYVGIRLNHTAFANYRLIYGYPLVDTTVIVEGFYENQNFVWGFLYPNNVWEFPYRVIKFRTPIPLDTFDLEIKF
jgi:hypothetical protein